MIINNLEKLFNEFKNLKVLIVGDIMLDTYIYGDVNRISPEAPVPILNKTEETFKLGGAGNVALNIKKLGAEPTLISYIGDDQYGRQVKTLLEENDINTFLISNGKPTTVKKRVISGNTHLLRIDIEDTSNINDFNEEVLKIYCNEIVKHDVVILSDYNKGLLTHNNITDLIEFAKDNGVTIVVDPKVNNFNEYYGVDLIKPNLKEAIQGMGCSPDIDLSILGSLMKSDLNVSSVMITLSEDGIYWKGKTELNKGATPVDIADPCGCGDAVIAVCSMMKFLNISERALVDISNIAGSMVCEQFGVVQVESKELLERCQKLKVSLK